MAEQHNNRQSDYYSPLALHAEG